LYILVGNRFVIIFILFYSELSDDQMHFRALINLMIQPVPGDRVRLCEVESILNEIVGVPMVEPIQQEKESDSFDYCM
jgi:hypothetical protein